MAVSQSLTVTETSYSTADNTSQVRIVWTSTQTGLSYNDYGVPGEYYISINGSSEVKYNVEAKRLVADHTVTLLDTTITVPHKDDGTGSIKVRTWMNTNISAGIVEKSEHLNLTTIARASTIAYVSNKYLGTNCDVRWTPKAEYYCYKLKFSMGNWEYTTDVITPYRTTQYTYTGYPLSYEAAKQIPNTLTGTMTVTLYTYSDRGATSQIGSASSKTFTVTVPDNVDTKPNVTMTLSKEDSLGSAFDGIYIQGYSKVKATFTGGEAKYGATIKSYSVTIEGTELSSPYTSDYLNNPGEVWLVGKVTDSRGISNTTSKKIIVTAYTNPKVVAVAGETNVACGRCDVNGNWSDSGTYLKIKAKRNYSKCIVDGVQKNFCGLRYRYKLADDTDYSDWINLLNNNNLSTDEVITSPLLNGALSVEESYLVQVDAVDSIPNHTPMTFTIQTEKIYMHRAGSIRSLGIGTYVDTPNTVKIADDITIKMGNSLNGVFMNAKAVSGVNNFDIQTKYADFTGTGNGNERQTFFIFGEANGKIVYGVARVSNSGVTIWQGTDGVTLSSKAGGKLTVTLPTTAYDMFTVLSCRKFTL